MYHVWVNRIDVIHTKEIVQELRRCARANPKDRCFFVICRRGDKYLKYTNWRKERLPIKYIPPPSIK